MKLNAFFSIIDREELPNQYLRLTLYVPNVKMDVGHYLIIQDTYPCYVMGQHKDKVELLLEPNVEALISLRQTLHLTELKGEVLPSPSKEQFTLLIVEPGGLGACLFYLKKFRTLFKGFTLIGTESNFPFLPCPARQMVYGMPSEVIAALPLLEDWSIPNRLASLKEMPGVYHGAVQSLADIWLEYTSLENIKKIKISSLSLKNSN